MINIKLLGDWGKSLKLFKNLSPELKNVAISSQRTIAEAYVRMVKNHLKNQDIPGWTPLSPKYADKKMGKYGHEDILMASKLYYMSIKAWRENNVYMAGVKRGLTYPNGVEISRVAAIHEDWSMMPGKPHRPLWSYTLEFDLGGIKGIKKEVVEIIKRKLIAKGYPVRTLKL